MRKKLKILALVLVVTVVGVLIFDYISVDGGEGKCWPAEIMISSSRYDDTWRVTVTNVKTECTSDSQSQVTVTIISHEGEQLVSGTVKEIREGGSLIEYVDVSPPGDRVNPRDYFIVPVTNVPEGSVFHIGSLNRWSFWSVTLK